MAHLGYGQTHISSIRRRKDEKAECYDGYVNHTETIQPIAKGSGGADEHIKCRAMHVLVIVELRLQDALGSKCPNGGQSGQRGSQMGVYGRPSYLKNW